jgi:hypothetical protein
MATEGALKEASPHLVDTILNDASLDWTTLNGTTLNKLKQNMSKLFSLMSKIEPSKFTINELDDFRKSLSETVHVMDNYPDNIKKYVVSAMIWVVAALNIASVDYKDHTARLLQDTKDFYEKQKSELRRIRFKGNDGFELTDEENKKYLDFRDSNITSMSDQDVDNIIFRLTRDDFNAGKEKAYFENQWNLAKKPTGSDALIDVKAKIDAIEENPAFNPSALNTRINDLILILTPKNSSTGGRRRTNKKRSTRRKKKRGKRRRSYRTKR